jgi:exodeoxyribonuclease V beta subunit
MSARHPLAPAAPAEPAGAAPATAVPADGARADELGPAPATASELRPGLAPRPPALPAADAALVVVEASAGTGKTYFLEHRVIDLVLGAGAALGEILVVTFTEKAVAELRLRIRDLLDRLARTPAATADLPTAEAGRTHWVIDEAARRRLRAALAAFDHAPIFTIHGYCHRLLIEDAFAAQRLFEQTQVADEVAFDAAFTALLRERFARARPERDLLAAFLSTGRPVHKLRDILLGCARAGQDARVRRHADPDALRELAAHLHGELGTEARRGAVARTLSLVGSDPRWVPKWLDEIGGALARVDPDAPLAYQLAAIDELREPAAKLLERVAKAQRRAESDPATRAHGGGLSAVADALRRAATAVSLDEAVAAALLPAVLDRVRTDKLEQGLFDYDDMLQLVWRALSGPRAEELAARLRARTPWAMIDEAQDTDPVQWSIFRTVWMHADARGLTIVGDPKQSIYAFRGADVGTYLAARDELLRSGAARVALDVNRRSTPELVDAVNDLLVGTPLMPLLDQDILYDEPVRASGDVRCTELRPPLQVLALAATSAGDGRIPVDAVRAAHAAAIAAGIEALRAAPPQWTSRAHPSPPPFALAHVMVLTRTNRDSTELAAALRARGLPCALVEPERLFQTREAAELAAILAAVAAPRDRSARLRALRTRFCSVPWAELMQVVDAPDHHPLIARIFDWAQLASRREYEALFRRLVEDSRYAERALVLGAGERALTNTWHLIELLLAEVARSRADLHELVAQLRRWIADETASPDERDVQRAETDGDAVRVLTIHKAKGLEAPYVFLYGGLSGGPRSEVATLRDPVGRAIVVGAQDDETRAKLRAADEAESQRLAYVALTRAQVRLYLPLYGADLVREQAMYWPIQRCLKALVDRAAPGRVAITEVPVHGDEAPPPPPEALAALAVPPAPPTRGRAPLAAARAGLALVSYTRLARDAATAAIPVDPADALAVDRAELDADDSAGEVAPGELPPGAAAGLLLHDVLERAELSAARHAPSAEAWARDPEVRELLAEAARARGIDAHYLPHAAGLAYAALTAPMALADGTALPPIAAARAIAREVELCYPIPAAAHRGQPSRYGLVKGYLDALVAWDDEELWVIDYKSDLLAGAELPAAALRRVRERYAVQARLYAIGAARLRGHRRLAGLVFAFLRHRVAVPLRVDAAQLAAWTAWLAALPEEATP